MSRNGHFMLGSAHAIPELADAARRFSAGVGSPLRRPPSYGGVYITPEMQGEIGGAYNALPHDDPRAHKAYGAMAEETKRQFDFLTAARQHGGLGYDVQVQKTDPYNSATGQQPASAMGTSSMFNEIFHDRRLRVLGSAETGGHPFFSDDENNMFRAVHDMFGHAATGRGVDRHGEEAAYQSHASMYTPLARRALATETRGQNAAMISAGGVFQPQKVALLPQRLIVPGYTAGTQASRTVAAKQATIFHEQQFGGLLGALKQVGY